MRPKDRLAFTLWKAPRLGEGLKEEIVDWITTTPDARLLIIDILEKIRPPRKPHGNNYAQDYEPTATLNRARPGAQRRYPDHSPREQAQS